MCESGNLKIQVISANKKVQPSSFVFIFTVESNRLIKSMKYLSFRIYPGATFSHLTGDKNLDTQCVISNRKGSAVRVPSKHNLHSVIDNCSTFLL